MNIASRDAQALFIVWSDAYSIGIQAMDRQHQEILASINELHQARRHGETSPMLDDILRRLDEQTRQHFFAEEGLLMRHNYPEFREHKAMHDRMIDKTFALRLSVRDGELPQATLRTLRDWWLHHIMGCDISYVPFVTQSAVAAS